MLDRVKELLGGSDELDEYRQVLLPTTREEIIVEAGDGAEARVRRPGEEAKWVVDGTAQVGTAPLGHNNEAMLAAMEQFYADEIPKMTAGNDIFHPLQQELAETFSRIYPGDTGRGDIKTYFCNSGSEAVERGCLKAAQLHRGGNTYIGFHNAFHGRTSLALSCNFSKAAHTEGYNSLFRTFPVPYAEPGDDVAAVLDELRQVIAREGPDNVNAVIVEPVQGEGGYTVPHPEFLPGVREITADHDIPLIADEVQASLRTGSWFSCQQFDIQPDMISVAKAFSGGVTPFGASLIRDEYATEETGKHSGTFGGNPKECFAALKTIEVIQDNDYLDHAAAMGDRLADAWSGLTGHDAVVDERGIGLFRGIEFETAAARDAVLEELYTEHDILTAGCGHDNFNPAIRFLLPVNVDEAIIDRVAAAVPDAVRTAT